MAALKKLESKVKQQTTEMLIKVFKGFESLNTNAADTANTLVMNELESRLTEENFTQLLNEVYEF